MINMNLKITCIIITVLKLIMDRFDITKISYNVDIEIAVHLDTEKTFAFIDASDRENKISYGIVAIVRKNKSHINAVKVDYKL